MMNTTDKKYSARPVLPAVALAFATLLPVSASAAYVATLEFAEPTGTVGPTDTVPMRLRLTLHGSSDPLVLSDDVDATPPLGVPVANYPTSWRSGELEDEGLVYYEFVAVDSLSFVGVGGYFICNDTFTAGSCSSGPYRFAFDYTSPDSPFVPNFSFGLQPGDSMELAFGSMIPNDPQVAAGTYHAYGAALNLTLHGTATFRVQETDENGEPVFDEFGEPVWLPDFRYASASGDIELASTPCTFNADPSCVGAFSRTVVPLPGAAWLFATALGTLGWRLARRS